VQRVLDIDLDAFLYAKAYSRDRDDPRLNADDFLAWEPEKLKRFLSDRCLLTEPVPGLAVTHHADVFYAWRQAIDAGILKPRFHVTHVDAHSDIAYADSGRTYLRHELLALPVTERRDPKTGDEGLGDGNFLAYAVANRWIHSIEYVIGGRCDFGDEDTPPPPYDWQPGDLVFQDFEDGTPFCRVLQITAAKGTADAEPEPPVAFDWILPAHFQAAAPYDFIFLTQSPPYTPPTADALYAEIERRFVGSWPPGPLPNRP
jgi:hypothetical protein